MFDVASVVIGAVVATVVVGFIAHKWPEFFSSKVSAAAAAVNADLKKAEEAVKSKV